MLIQKTSQSIMGGNVLNTDSTSNVDTYSCQHINNKYAPKYAEFVSTSDQTPDANRNIYEKWQTEKYNSNNYFFLMNNVACCALEEHIVQYSITLWIENTKTSYAWITVHTQDFYGAYDVTVGSYMIGQTSAETWQSVTITGFAKMGTATSRIIFPQIHFNSADSNHKTRGGTYEMTCYMSLRVID